jgi:hypothetical protein
MKFKFTAISIFLLILCSCDCVIKVTGKVLDKESNKPVIGATVDLLKGADLEKTNEKGIFEVIRVSGFCKDPLINVSLVGYKPFQIEIKKSKGCTQFSVKTELTWVDYKQPYYPDPNNKNTYIYGIWINKWSQDFTVNDTLIIYLSKDNLPREIEQTQVPKKTKSTF